MYKKHDHWASFNQIQWSSKIKMIIFCSGSYRIIIVFRQQFHTIALLNQFTWSYSYSQGRMFVSKIIWFSVHLNLIEKVTTDSYRLSCLPSYQFSDRPLLANSNLSTTKCVKFSVSHFVLFVNSELKLLADQQHLLSLFFKLMCILTNVPIKNGFVIYAVYF